MTQCHNQSMCQLPTDLNSTSFFLFHPLICRFESTIFLLVRNARKAILFHLIWQILMETKRYTAHNTFAHVFAISVYEMTKRDVSSERKKMTRFSGSYGQAFAACCSCLIATHMFMWFGVCVFLYCFSITIGGLSFIIFAFSSANNSYKRRTIKMETKMLIFSLFLPYVHNRSPSFE